MRLDPRWAAPVLAAATVTALSAPREAQAYPWMVHHTYTSCAQCHVDPSGGGVMTEYGRAQGEILLRTHYKPMEGDAGSIKDFMFGAVKLPQNVQLQADVRGLMIPDPAAFRAVLMQADLRGAVQFGPVSASASLGAVSAGARPAQVTGGDTWNLVSREYWVGVNAGKNWMIRAGRMNLPFGLRTEDHILDVRQATRTNTNDQQQTGVSVFFGSRKWRAEIMGIAGNFQVRPDSFRERGYSLYAAFTPKSSLEIGVSSLLSAAQTDLETSKQRTRLAEGIFARWAPVPELALMAEADLLLDSQEKSAFTPGFVSTLIADYEPVQGLHLQAIGEQCDSRFGDGLASSWTGTGAVQWFFLPHTDLRVDAGYGTVYCSPGVQGSPFGLVQLHFFL